ncbi:MAG: hypothetical protein ACRC8A_20045 [Microcoleaceae cyanobacterium]
MKGLKLVAATVLAVGAVIGSVVEGAVGVKQTGINPIGGRFDSTELDYSFTLFPTVEDRDSDNTKGFFQNAITDFTGGFEDFGDLFAFDLIEIVSSDVIADVDRNDSGYEFIDEPLTLNLRANLQESDDRIEYILEGYKLTERGVNGLALIINDLSVNSFLDTLEERELAVNDLDYIINNRLLGLIDDIQVTGPSSDGSGIVVRNPDNSSLSVISAESISRLIAGNKATGNRFDSTELDYSFTLFPTVEDRDVDNTKGFFQNAITDFTGGFEDLDDLFAFDLLEIVESSVIEDNDITDIGYEFIDEPLTLNLRANLQESDDRIEYILRGDQLRRRGINGLALTIDDLSNHSFLDTLEERELAVNDLDYIIGKGLLGLVNDIRVTGLSSDGSGRIARSSGFDEANVEFIVRPIPESNPSSSLLALGALGVGLGVKRRLQMK